MESEIDACLHGEMCKIMRVDNRHTKEVWYEISTNVTDGGWDTGSGRAFHSVSFDDEKIWTGLGTFYLISCDPGSDGRCVLVFTDDLNPDAP